MKTVRPQFDLNAILRPTPVQEFQDSFWERNPLVVQRCRPEYYAGLFSIADIDKLITFSTPLESIRLVRTEGTELSNRRLPRDGYAKPNIFDVYKAFNDGYTVIVDGIDQRWDAIAAMCRSLESEMQHRVGANLYFTPRNAQGFLPHFDTHDVFVLQLEGQKKWRIMGEESRLPLAGEQRPETAEGLTSPVVEAELSPGDSLYIPRGWTHDALTSDAPSLHLTVGIHVTRWMDVVQEAVRQAARTDEQLRRAVPGSLLCSPEAASLVQRQLTDLLGPIARPEISSAVVDGLHQRFLERRPVLPDGHFESLDRSSLLQLDSVVSRRSGMSCTVFANPQCAKIVFPGNGLTGPPAIAPDLEFIARVPSFRVRDLPGRLTDSGKKVLVARLVREGLLSVQNLHSGESNEAG